MEEMVVSAAVTVVEVAPRDGLQNEPVSVPTKSKIELIRHLAATGVRRIEAVSFAHPRSVPQMADAEAVMAALPRGTVSWIGLVLNEVGLERAIASRVDEVNFVVVATDEFSRRNQGITRDESIGEWLRIAAGAKAAGLRTTVTVAAAFGCPFEGPVDQATVERIVQQCLAGEPDEIALADTIGVGVPSQVEELAGMLARVAPELPTRWHFHNTRNTGYANAITAVNIGASALDSSSGGIGGCPFAPQATGNIATEDLTYLLERSGVHSGLDRQKVLDAARRVGELLGQQVPGLLTRSGWFPTIDGDETVRL